MNTAHRGEGAVCQIANRSPAGHIRLYGEALHALCLDLRGGFSRLLHIYIAEDDVHARIGECEGHSPTYAASAPGDDCCLASKFLHALPP